MVAVSDRRIKVCKVGLLSLAAGGARGAWCWGFFYQYLSLIIIIININNYNCFQRLVHVVRGAGDQLSYMRIHTPHIQCLQYRSQIWDLKFGTFAIKKVPNLGVTNLAPILQALNIISQLDEGDWV